ncbi:MAG: ABC transporter permease, partial [Dokdonella sp.]
MWDTLIQDIRYAVRTLAARPAFAAAAIVTLAIGIGANAAIFSAIDALLLRSLPYPNGDRLVAINNAYPKTGEFDAGSTIPDYLDRRQQAPSLANSAIYQYASFNLTTGSAPVRLIGAQSTPTLFPTLGTQALLGRVLADDDAVAGRERVAVLSFDAWQNQFAGEPGIIGRDLRLDHDVYRVVGVMPKGFFFPDRDVQLWTPYVIQPEQLNDEERGNSDVQSIGLLKPGATIAELETEFRTITARNAARSSQLRTDYGLTGFVTHAVSLKTEWFGGMRQTLWLLQGMVALLLLVSSVNVINLVLVRFSARRRDFALRSALGADRRRLTRQIVIESALLAALGGATGLVLAAFGLPLLGHIGLAATRRAAAIDFAMGWGPVGFVFVLSVAMGLLLGMVTASSLRRAHNFDLLRAGGQSGGTNPAGGRLRNALVVGQFALTLVLLVAAGLLLKSFLRLQQTDPGFVSKYLLTARLDLPKSDYADAAAQTSYYQRLLVAARAM